MLVSSGLPIVILRLFTFLQIFLATSVAGAVPSIVVESIKVNGKDHRWERGDGLHLPPGPHDLEFAVRVDEGDSAIPLRVRATLAGHEDDWREVSGQMALVAEFLDAEGGVIAGERFPFSGDTPGLRTEWKYAELRRYREPLLVPSGSRKLRITLSSGAPQTTGRLILDSLTVNMPDGGPDPTDDLWRNSGFNGMQGQGAKRLPDGWKRGGTQPAIALLGDGPSPPALALLDNDPLTFGEWVSEQELDDRVQAGMSLSLSWKAAWSVKPGNRHTITYSSVGSGDYDFRVAGIAASGSWKGAGTSVKIHVASHLWERRWFWPLASGGLIALLSGVGILLWHQKMQRELERLAAQHALERDRARIAQDMHDDLGARLTRISLVSALAEREINAGDTRTAGQHVNQLSALSREIVEAIDEIVWAVDSGNDSLDHLGTYLCRFADEFFAESQVRCRFGIPSVLPPVPLGAEVRHNLFLAVKEALNNIARHAGPCEARLEMSYTRDQLVITVSDNGKGFVPSPGLSGNGLRNMERRLADIGGLYEMASSAEGTTVRLLWKKAAPALGKPGLPRNNRQK